MPKNISTNFCRRLQRLIVSYKSEISLHFDLLSLYGCRTLSLLLWALTRVLYLDTARFNDLPTVRSLTFLASWASKNNRLSSTTKFNSCTIFMFVLNSSAQVHLIDFQSDFLYTWKNIFRAIIFLYSPCHYMRAWIHILDAPSCYECTAWAERKSALQGSGLVRTVEPCAQSRVPWAIGTARDDVEQ